MQPSPQELEEWRRAYRLGGRVSHLRRIFTLIAAFDFFAVLPISAILQDVIPPVVEDVAVGGVSAFIVATLAAAFKEIYFQRKDRDLQRRYSIWQAGPSLPPSFLAYRRAVLRRWLTGKDPDWYSRTPT